MNIKTISKFIVLALLACSLSAPAPADTPLAVPTFHCIGLYWNTSEGSPDNTCGVRYRPAGSDTWKTALPLWFDSRPPETISGTSLRPTATPSRNAATPAVITITTTTFIPAESSPQISTRKTESKPPRSTTRKTLPANTPSRQTVPDTTPVQLSRISTTISPAKPLTSAPSKPPPRPSNSAPPPT